MSSKQQVGPLLSLDIFAGVGGMTLGLKGLAHPLAYCECASNAQTVLRYNMKRGMLPRAPICPDIHDLNPSWLGRDARRVQLITAGFPCVGFSTAGARQGFHNHESALFFEMLRALDALVKDGCPPPALFLENVPNILRIGMPTIVRELVRRRMYQLRWCTFAAAAIGAPQRRSRWFALAVPAAFKHVWHHVNYQPFKWVGHEPQRMMKRPTDRSLKGLGDAGRIALLGNAVVPDAARVAFLYLLHPSSTATSTDRAMFSSDVLKGKGAPITGSAYPPNGVVDPRATRHAHKLPALVGNVHDFKIVMLPHVYTRAGPISPRVKDLISHLVHRTHWGTLTKVPATSHYLTQRSVRKVQVQARFEASTPEHLRSGELSASFAEWLTGMPRGWTKAS